MGVSRLALVGLIAVATPAYADVDWAKGLVTAKGVGLADRQAPNPAVARGPSRRKAEEAAKLALAAQLPALPLATGGTLADKLTDAAIKARVDRAVATAISLTADPETDGSWRVTMAVSIEALRQAISGPRALPATGDAAAPVIVIEGATATPAIGTTVGGLAAPTLFVTAVPAWAKDAPRIKATASTPGAIEAAVPKAAESTLFVILTSK
jgi:hypothetical protein